MKDEILSWQSKVKEKEEMLSDKYLQSYDTLENTPSPNINQQKGYLIARAKLIDYVEPTGKQFKENKEFEDLLTDAIANANREMQAFTKNQSTTIWTKKYEEDCKSVSSRKEKIAREKESVSAEIKEVSVWIQDYTQASEATDRSRKQIRDELEKTRYYLSRLESSVFEQEVWDALAPDKESCGIQIMDIELLKNGHQKQTRILYKSDLIFYLKIYMELYPVTKLPEYSVICIDEGQDLHSVDYTLLKSIYPTAVLNVFGDTAQVLHESCGIGNWQADTGIEIVDSMDVNYRNTVEIVEFCREEFGATMRGVGSGTGDGVPTVINNAAELKQCLREHNKVTVVVRDRKAFSSFCLEAGINEDEYEFLDTNADKETANKHHVYSVFAAKGIEFPEVIVYSVGMTNNQKIVSCTRAMKSLYYFKEA